ncbi:MAG: hypothetical protein K9G67_15535 [Bacteroidales bacterium]|nr:hypothetical protein [Bacteroidales bacterium]MCF8343880.1 hypothetical protein [Bacteroidales bacterium]MCF8350406.1 hypothetical protein [Bacteroidales bacterium]MCF8377768.1 hypothetical protein [Bacteroidales bacterium]
MAKNKNKKILTIGSVIIASAIIWGLVIIGTSYALRGTECYDRIQNYLVGGVLAHIMLLGGFSISLFKKEKDQE